MCAQHRRFEEARTMTQPTHAQRTSKGDRNTHETSAEESKDPVPIAEQKRGGGYRSGSSGSGTLEQDTAPLRDHAQGMS
jgi:hypothetical protein